MARNDNTLKTHLDNSTVFRGLSPDIQNDLIQSVAEVMIEKIKTEISKTDFVALILDEASDITMKSQLSATFRYVTEDGNVQERFVHYTDVSSDRKADSLLQHTLQILKDFGCADKLVAQTYDGAAVMAGEHSGLQTRLREHCKTATFIHCYAHKLNLVLSQSASFIKPVKIFFTNLLSFSVFFAKSSKRTRALATHVRKRIPTVAPTRWNFQSRIVQTAKEHKEDLEGLFQAIVEDQNQEWDRETTICARGFLTLLRDFDFNFFLDVFSAIFPHSESLFKILQSKISDIAYCNKKIDDFKSHIQRMREEFSDIWERMERFTSDYRPPNKRMRLDSIPEEDKKSTYARLFYEILDVIILNITQRFSEISKLKFLRLLDSTLFDSFVKNFPDELFSSLLTTDL
ncbi:zinc finger MYM-type protein 1-like [Photinus pyralis]|uniref:zinc finger MYM-type protein 1-like n=1 Tax=Photinus pyralis TaxID=7054 RepID=UPI0012670FF2|nr:zinc finger MYM-type protein 1-like [Photinus pyralis]XP_031329671.1 zinc finger MYM-type protein 1-like [Photinus pyralis]XP_031358459.1 zinc finger MYM-type protein 1-like [Photinus pyralis]